MTFDVTKPVQTRDGRKARIVCTDRKGAHPIIALIQSSSGNEGLHSFCQSGKVHDDEEGFLDLINIPEKRVFKAWKNIYESDNYTALTPFHDTRDEANEHCVDSGRVACKLVEIPYTPGEGLE